MLRRWLDGGRRDRIGIPNATPGLAGTEEGCQYILAAVDNDRRYGKRLATSSKQRHAQSGSAFSMAQMPVCLRYFT